MAYRRKDLDLAVAREFGDETPNGMNCATDAVTAVLRSIEKLTNDGESLILNGFGTFAQRYRRAHTTRNPRTGAPMDVPASTRLGFKGSKR